MLSYFTFLAITHRVKITFDTKPIVILLFSFQILALIFFFLVFSDEILMPQDSPPIMQMAVCQISYFVVSEVCAGLGELS